MIFLLANGLNLPVGKTTSFIEHSQILDVRKAQQPSKPLSSSQEAYVCEGCDMYYN